MKDIFIAVFWIQGSSSGAAFPFSGPESVSVVVLAASACLSFHSDGINP